MLFAVISFDDLSFIQWPKARNFASLERGPVDCGGGSATALPKIHKGTTALKGGRGGIATG